MNVKFETVTKVFDEDGAHVGDIETPEGGHAYFESSAECCLTADELRAIADKLDELNGVNNGR